MQFFLIARWTGREGTCTGKYRCQIFQAGGCCSENPSGAAETYSFPAEPAESKTLLQICFWT